MIQFANKLTQSIAFRTFIIVVIVLADRERNRVRHEEHRVIKSWASIREYAVFRQWL